MALTTNYTSTLDVNLELHAKTTEKTLGIINKQINDMSKLLDNYSKNMNKYYTSQEVHLKKLIALEEQKNKLSDINKTDTLNAQIKKERELTKIRTENKILLEKELAPLKNKLSIEKEIAKSEIKMSEQAKWVEQRKELATYHKELNEVNTSFGHLTKRALATVPAFYAAYTMLNAITSTLKEAVGQAVLFDNTFRTLSAITGEATNTTRVLTEEVFRLGNVYGGTLDAMAKTVNEFARAGIATKELANATRVATQLALITGDSIESTTNAIVSYSQVYGKVGKETVYTTEEIGDKLAYIANASRLSIESMGTVANYALAAAKSVGITIDQVTGLQVAFSNAGNSASTIGTQIRRFTSTLTSSSSSVKEFYKTLGVNRTAFLNELSKSKDGSTAGIKASNEAFKKFVLNIKSLSENEFKTAISGMNVLDTQFFNQLRNNADEIVVHMNRAFTDVTGELQKTGIIVDGIGKKWEIMWNKVKNSTGAASEEPLAILTEGAFRIQEDIGLTYDYLTNLFDNTGRAATTNIMGSINQLKKLKYLYDELNKGGINTEADKSFKHQLELAMAYESQLIKINRLKQQGNTVSDSDKNRLTILDLQHRKQKEITKALDEGYAKESAHILEITSKYDKMIAKQKQRVVEQQKLLEVKQKQKAFDEALKNLNNYKDKANNDVVKRLEEIVVEKAKAIGLDNEHIKQLGLTHIELDKTIEKYNVIKSITTEQLRDLGTYGKLVSKMNIGLDSSTYKSFIKDIEMAVSTQVLSLKSYMNNLVDYRDKINKNKLNLIDPNSIKASMELTDELVKQGKLEEAKQQALDTTTKLQQFKVDITNEENRLIAEGVSKEDKRFSILNEVKETVNNLIHGQASINTELNISVTTTDALASNMGRVASETINAVNSTLKLSNAMFNAYAQAQKLMLAQKQLEGSVSSNAIKLANPSIDLDVSIKKAKELKAVINQIKMKELQATDGKAKEKYKNEVDNLIKQRNAELTKQDQLRLKINTELKNQKLEHLKTEDGLYKIKVLENVAGKDAITKAKAEVTIAKEHYETVKKIEASKGVDANKLNIENAKLAVLQAEDSLTKAIENSNKKAAKASKSKTKELKKQYDILIAYYKLMGNDEKVRGLQTEQKYDKYKSSGLFNKKQLATIQKELEKVNKLAGMDFANAYSDAFKNVLDGDIKSAFESFFNNISTTLMTPFVNNISKSMDNMTKSLVSSFNLDLNSFSGSAIMGGLGLGIDMLFKGIGELLSSEETPPELKSMHKESKSMSKALDVIENAQYPLLEYTKQQTDYLRIIASSFGNIGNKLSLSGLDIGGDFYKGKSKGGFFSTKSYELYGTDIRFDEATMADWMNGNAQAYFDEITKKTYDSWFKHKVTYNTKTTDVSDMLAEDLQNATISIFDSLKDSAKLLGVELGDMSNYSIDLGKIDTTGKSAEEVAQEIESRFSATFDQMTQDYFGFVGEFQQAGEELGATLVRVTSTFEQVSYAIGKFGQNIDWRVSNYLADASGGMDAFFTNYNSYIENFFSDSEQLAFMQKDLAKSFEAYGQTLPKTKDEYRALLESIDLTDKSSAEAYAGLLSLNGAFAEYIDKLNDVGDVTDDTSKNILEKSIQFYKDIINELNNFWQSDLSYLNAYEKQAKYDQMASYYQDNGDTQNYLDSLKTKLEYDKKLATTREEYAYYANSYVDALKNAKPNEATLNDVVKTIEELKADLNDTKEAIVQIGDTNIALQSEIVNNTKSTSDAVEASNYRS